LRIILLLHSIHNHWNLSQYGTQDAKR